jgi:cytoskeletal protein RodZ
MNPDILKKLERRVDRRTFLRGSGIAAAAVIGVAAFPLVSAAQAQSTDKPAEAKKDDKAADAGQTAQEQKKEEKKEDAKDKKEDAKDKKEESKDAKNVEPDPFKVTKKDEQGRDYRLCPQCGYNMYKQDKTWTCENCGYSYDE